MPCRLDLQKVYLWGGADGLHDLTVRGLPGGFRALVIYEHPLPTPLDYPTHPPGLTPLCTHGRALMRSVRRYPGRLRWAVTRLGVGEIPSSILPLYHTCTAVHVLVAPSVCGSDRGWGMHGAAWCSTKADRVDPQPHAAGGRRAGPHLGQTAPTAPTAHTQYGVRPQYFRLSQGSLT